MKLHELTARLDAQQRTRRTDPSNLGQGRTNKTTGIRGICAKKEKNGRMVYCVFTATTPALYVGRARTLEEAQRMQADFVPTIEPRDCSGIRGVRWVQSAYRASVTIRGELYRKQGFKTPEEAKAWRDEIIAKHL